MTRYAILADIHGHFEQLQAVVQDARQRDAQMIVDLGDTGSASHPSYARWSNRCYDLLRQLNARAVFGNYEVSGWIHLSAENQEWVRGLEPFLQTDTFVAAHAAPFMPASLRNVEQVMDYLLENDVKWDVLFPRMNQDENVRWLTYAELEERNVQICFHGHTHLQQVWRIGPTGAMAALRGKTIPVDSRGRYIVGVGSVGQPQEDATPRYVIYDQDLDMIELCMVGRNKTILA